MATQLLMDALNDELSQLNIANLRVAMKAEGERGRASFKLVLERPGRMPASDVLSEGEQRAVAIASFLTERRLSGDGSGVIFDDPVCSMDHRYRQRVARRLAKEAAGRQVIVFTHDMFFLFALMDEAQNLEVDIAPRTVSQTQDGFGVTTDELPFDGSTTKARVGTCAIGMPLPARQGQLLSVSIVMPASRYEESREHVEATLRMLREAPFSCVSARRAGV